MIGIIGAMDQEVADLVELMENPREEKRAGMTFRLGTLGGQETALVRSGVGKVNAAVAAEILADRYQCGALINTGVAGSLDAEINIGDIVLSTEALEHDMNVTGLGYARGVIPDQKVSVFPADKKLRKIGRKVCEKVNPDIRVFEGRVVSGDIFVSDGSMKQNLAENMQGICAEMEGASIAHVAWLNQIPYLVIRAISDKADGSAQEDYPSFQKKAIFHTVRLVVGMLQEISKE